MTAIDTNVFVTLWDENAAVYSKAREALDTALSLGPLIVAAPVYAELLAWPARTERMLDEFFAKARIVIDWEIPEQVWRIAGAASQGHNMRRRVSKGGEPRRIIADFVIGAHAMANGCSLLTLDREFFQRNFPGLTVKSFP